MRLKILLFLFLATTSNGYGQQYGEISNPAQLIQPDPAQWKNLWVVTRGFEYLDPDGMVWRVEDDFHSDLASIPKFLWWVIGSPDDEKFSEAALLHDKYIACKTRSTPATNTAFYNLLRLNEVSKFKARLMFFAVFIHVEEWEIGDQPSWLCPLSELISFHGLSGENKQEFLHANQKLNELKDIFQNMENYNLHLGSVRRQIFEKIQDSTVKFPSNIDKIDHLILSTSQETVVHLPNGAIPVLDENFNQSNLPTAAEGHYFVQNGVLHVDQFLAQELAQQGVLVGSNVVTSPIASSPIIGNEFDLTHLSRSKSKLADFYLEEPSFNPQDIKTTLIALVDETLHLSDEEFLKIYISGVEN